MSGLVERVLGWLGRGAAAPVGAIASPARQWQGARVVTRSFDGGGSGNLAHGFSTTDWHINQSLYRNLRVLRARSRDLARNNDYARQFLRMLKTNVVGPTGFSLQVHAKKRDGSIDETDADRCEDAFEAWGCAESCDYLGKLSWVEFCWLWIETLARDGEVLVRRMKGSGPQGYQLHLLDPALLDETYNVDSLPGGRKIRMGIELDAENRVLAYHLIQGDPADPRKLLAFGVRQFVRVPADEIWHDFLVEAVGQLRGVPWMASTLLRQNRLAGFENAALAAAEEGAKKVAWIKTPDGDGTPLANAMDTSGEPDNPSPTSGTLYTEAGDGVHYAALPPGYEIGNFDPTYPHQDFGPFVKAMLRGISAGLGTAYHTLANDLEGVNFSSARAGILEEREVWKTLQGWMICKLCERVYSEWLPFAILTGALKLPIEKLAKFDAAVWQGRRWTWVDPLKDVQAGVLAVDNGLTSRGKLIRDMGMDPEDVWTELEKEKARLEGLLKPVAETKPNAPKPATQADPGAEGDAAAGAEDSGKGLHIAEGAIVVRAGDVHMPAAQVELTAPTMDAAAAAIVAAAASIEKGAAAIGDARSELKGAAQDIRRTGSDIREAARDIARPRRVVTDKAGNPIGTVAVDKLEG